MINRENLSDIHFLMDSTENKDGSKEIIMDYVVSWTLRHAQNFCMKETPHLCCYARKFLGKLICEDLDDNDMVIVKTWKQYCYIDLWVYVNVNGVEHDILIEDKYYSKVHNNQLSKYKTIFENYLADARPASKKHYWLLNCFDSNLSTKIYDDVCRKNGFKILFWDDMRSIMGLDNYGGRPSESEIFNEFWAEYWV